MSCGEALVLVWFALGMPKISETIFEFGGSQSSLTSLVANPAIHWGAPVFLLFMIVVFNNSFRQSRIMLTLSLMLTNVVGGAMVVAFYLGTQKPLIKLFKIIGR